MSDFNTKFKKILNDIEENIQNKDDLEYIKVQIFNLYNLFFDEINRIDELTTKKIETITNTQSQMEKRVEKLQNQLSSIEKELYLDEEEYDFSIVCPYCNNEFIIEHDEKAKEVRCPECNNIIELDWEENCEDHEGCNHNCSECEFDDEEDDM